MTIENSKFVAIDTSVFLHLLNPQNNSNNHIERLLVSLQEQNYCLLVDDKGRIDCEYQQKLENSRRLLEDYAELYRYWFIPDSKKKLVNVEDSDDLMASIESVVIDRNGKSAKTDRYFVYVSIKSNEILITNDKRDVICGIQRMCNESDCSRRNCLLQISCSYCSHKTKFFLSHEAFRHFVP